MKSHSELGIPDTSSPSKTKGVPTFVEAPNNIHYLEKYEELLDFGSDQDRENLEASLAYLNAEHEAKNLILVLGAGVSIHYGLPSWNTLIQKLMLHVFDDDRTLMENSGSFSELFTQVFAPNPLIMARFVKNKITQLEARQYSQKLENVIGDCFYSNLDPKKFERAGVLDEVCRLWKDGKKLKGVLTYNFDDLLEKKMKALKLSFESFDRATARSKPDSMPIYHVHGWIPESATESAEHIGEVVFSEEIYHQQYSDPVSWRNKVQMKAFCENACLFLGFSFTDPNVRRLLDAARKLHGPNQKSHYVVKRRVSRKDVEKKRVEILLYVV